MAQIRLLNTRTLKLEDHWESKLPEKKYAILSHCWSEDPSDEVIYRDLVGGQDVSRKKGFSKLKAFCELSLSLGYEGAWINTACINKDSTAELSTALHPSESRRMSFPRWCWSSRTEY